MDWLIYTLTLIAIASAAAIAFPLVSGLWSGLAGKVERYQQTKIDKAAEALDDIFMDVEPKWLKLAYGVTPVGVGVVVYVLWNNLLFAAVGAVAGLILPDVYLRASRAIRKQRFRGQLVDVLLVLSSSLRAGLSLTQAIEVIALEMSPPASQEFGRVIKAYRVGRTLEEALQRLNDRMASEELNLMTTALLVARETGGDVTRLISQVITTIREKKKLSEQVQTLTMQSKLQAYVMSLLPVAFAFMVRTFNPRYYDVLLRDAMGQMLLIMAAALWAVGMVLLVRLSKVDF